MSMDEILGQLNAQQLEAVQINEGSLLVFAGAGSGKTRVITTKIAYAIDRLGVKPWQILAVTFTNKACKEMQDRVVSMIGNTGRQVMIRTFHSFGLWLLRRHGVKVGLDPNFKIYDDDDSVALLCQAFPDVNKKEIAEYYKKIAILKDKMERPSKIDEKLVRYFNKYQEVLRRTGNVDFADMIIKSTQLLAQNKDVLQEVRNRFKMILVDEYQDSNRAQFNLLKLLVGPDTFICAVGDDDQSIYRFRGAEVQNILEFPKVFPNTKKVVLGTNYRCTESILEVAKDVIGYNKTRAVKDLNAEKRGGVKPKLYYLDNGDAESDLVVNLLKDLNRKDKTALENSAIIYRANYQSKSFEDRLMVQGIPYHIVGSLRFYDREEIRDCISIISLITNPRDSVAFQRMVNKPSRRIGETSIDKILALATNDPSLDGDTIQACRQALSSRILKGPANEGVASFVQAYDTCSQQFGTVNNGTLLGTILSEFGILEYYIKRDKDQPLGNNKRTDNIGQLVNMLASDDFSNGQDGINHFLEVASLDAASLGQDEGDSQEGVTLITMHNTKGLEFDRVFIVGMEDEIFPGRLDESTQADIEEERRICYVAMTRAREELYLFSASSRMRWGSWQSESPSMFLGEIKPEHIETIDMRTKPRFGSSFYFNSSDFDGYGGYYKSRYSSKYDDYSTPVQSSKKVAPNKYNIRSQGSVSATKPSVTVVKKPAPTAASMGITFEVGDRIKSDFYGSGVITGKRMFSGREVLEVKFDTGRTGTFVAEKVTFTKLPK